IKADCIEVLVPEIFQTQGNQRLRPVMKIKRFDRQAKTKKIPENEASTSRLSKTTFDMDSLLSYEWELKIGGETISNREFEKLLQSDQPLVYRNDQWILLNRNELKHIKNALKNKVAGQIKANDALFLGLTNKTYIKQKDKKGKVEKHYGPYDVILTGPIREVVDTLTGKKSLPKRPQPEQLEGKLRPYQLTGFNWLSNMTELGFNLCLADDMGLGKTIQVIAYMLQQREALRSSSKYFNYKVLVVCPTSVIGNWKRELSKFASSLKVNKFYGPTRANDLPKLTEYLSENEVIITSYGILRRDVKLLSLINWNAVILDESQNIKNYKAKQTKAAYELNAKSKICLTGTPIENHLIELWSMFHFLNPYLLGSRKKFINRYVIPVEKMGKNEDTERLRNTIMPFILRRLKTDKNIIKDLPEKNEIKLFITLSEEQKLLYEDVVKSSLDKLKVLEENENAKQIERSGIILKTLMKLKQVCNHPDQALHQHFNPDQSESIKKFVNKSGKLKRLIEMLEEIIESGSKILIFTQFTEMGDFLVKTIETIGKIKVLYLHGGVPQHKRDQMVDQFQNDTHYEFPIFVLSLKAGGTGLNLTGANIVLHFDRWWNPAVEKQATDRAYRIGQKQNVTVYKMISNGTVEEKIDKIIEQKKELAEAIVSASGEKWITDLSNSELKDLFTLEEDI
ncbi:MAG: ATP-dependent helicase, partial [Candidatus Lokiarchaeota archaeon]|nr:ATP-dependent helicase [Candidatus Lokiarchaeota archaeon]